MSSDPREHYRGRELQLYGPGQNGFDATSCYKQDFPAHPVSPRQVGTGAPQQLVGSSAPFEGSSCYKQDYLAHQIEPRPPTQGRPYQPNPAPFDGTTAYRDNYKGHNIDPSQYNRSTGARPYQPNPAPFDGKTCYSQDFHQHPLEPRAPHLPPQFQPNNAPFDAVSAYKADFKPHQVEPRSPAGPSNVGPLNTAPFQGQSQYKDAYKPHQIEPRPAGGPAQYQPNPAPFQGTSETREQFQTWPIDPSALQRGHTGPPPMHPTGPFDGTTMYQQEYRGWKLPPRRPALGVQMNGDRTYVLIPAEAPLPAVGKQIFTTVHDNQGEICVLVLRGDYAAASRNAIIGQFDLTGLPPGPKGSPRIEVTLQVDANNVLSATATDLDAGRQEQWLRHGSMIAKVHSQDVQTLAKLAKSSYPA